MRGKGKYCRQNIADCRYRYGSVGSRNTRSDNQQGIELTRKVSPWARPFPTRSVGSPISALQCACSHLLVCNAHDTSSPLIQYMSTYLMKPVTLTGTFFLLPAPWPTCWLLHVIPACFRLLSRSRSSRRNSGYRDRYSRPYGLSYSLVFEFLRCAVLR